ncbi:MerR family transcriptional regulator [Streptomyces cellulosae]|uniref:Uncharacterized protein n=1 Tax=Streptomyces cellulosae TaxID=1968 RepID=A0ABW7Y9D0_STRCE
MSLNRIFAGSLQALARTLEGWRRDLTLRGRAQLNAASQLFAYLDALDEDRERHVAAAGHRS